MKSIANTCISSFFFFVVAGFSIPVSFLALLSTGPYFSTTRWFSTVFMGYSDPHEWLDRATRPWALLILTSLVITTYVFVTFMIGSGILGHILLQPTDFTNLSGVDFLVCGYIILILVVDDY